MNFSLWLSALLTAATIGVDARTFETIPDRPCFRSMNGMMDSIHYLAADYPNLVTITDIGDSWLKNNEGRHDGQHQLPDGGYDIYALNITASDADTTTSRLTSEEKGKMLLTSGVHAREYAPPELLARFVEMMVHGYNENADVTWILRHTEIHAILYVNPDGRFMAERYPDLRRLEGPQLSQAAGTGSYYCNMLANLEVDVLIEEDCVIVLMLCRRQVFQNYGKLVKVKWS